MSTENSPGSRNALEEKGGTVPSSVSMAETPDEAVVAGSQASSPTPDDPLPASPGSSTPCQVKNADGTQELIARLVEEIAQLRTTFDEKIKHDHGRETVIDRLHSELQEYKADLMLKVLKPVVLDLINLHDDIGKIVAAHHAGQGEPLLLKLVGSFQSDVEDILYRHGFEAFTTDNPEFDPKRQRALRTLATVDASLDRRVAERLRKGFRYQDRIIRPEMVAVYTYKPAP